MYQHFHHLINKIKTANVLRTFLLNQNTYNKITNLSKREKSTENVLVELNHTQIYFLGRTYLKNTLCKWNKVFQVN